MANTQFIHPDADKIYWNSVEEDAYKNSLLAKSAGLSREEFREMIFKPFIVSLGVALGKAISADFD